MHWVLRGASSVRGDSLLALCIPAGCVALLAEAYFRTENGDADTSANVQFGPSDRCVAQHDIVRQLETHGIVVIPNAISPSAVRAARSIIRSSLFGFYKSANDDDVRQDTIAWIRRSENTKEEGTKGSGNDLDYCIKFLRGIPYALEKCGYSASRDLLVPRQCQLAIYPGDGQASYSRHLDQCKSSLGDLGLLEWMRLSDYRERSITTILYLNEPDRPISHGGALRYWVAMDKEELRTEDRCDKRASAFRPSFDVFPIGGTLVIFQSVRLLCICTSYTAISMRVENSDTAVQSNMPPIVVSQGRVEHQVMPSTADRYALTNWVSSVANSKTTGS